MNIVTIDSKEIKINSGLDETAFRKTNYDSIVTEEGLIATCENANLEKGEFSFSYKSWCFSEIKSINIEKQSEPKVFYIGKNNLSKNAKTFLEFFQDAEKEDAKDSDKERLFLASIFVCALLTQVAKEKSKLPLNGAGGIIIDLNEKSPEKTKLLFLPENLYKYSVAGYKAEDFSLLQGYWLNPTLYDTAALSFQRAAIAYKTLSKHFPFPETNSTARNSDILDKKYLPIELSVNGIDLTLAENINRGLNLNANSVSIPGKKAKGKKSEDLTPIPSFPLDLLYQAKKIYNKPELSNQDFEKKAEAYMKKKNASVTTKRKIRKNASIILGSIITAALVIFITVDSIKSNKDCYYSKGLTSTQTIEAFFKCINQKDTITIDNIIKGKSPRRYADRLSEIYVISKQRQAYNHDKGFLSPAGWCLHMTKPEKLREGGLYGVTKVKIDGKLSNLDPKMYKKNQEPSPITEENGITLSEGSKSVHKVEYYHVHSEGEENTLFIESYSSTFTLTYIKEKWSITDIISDYVEIPIDTERFFMDYFEVLEKNNYDVIESVRQLTFNYDWLPQKEVILKEKKRLEEIALDPFGIFE